MFTHVMVGADDLQESQRFYDAVLGALGVPAGTPDERGRVFWRTARGMFGVTRPIDGEGACRANGSTIGFAANHPDAVMAFHAAGLAAGGTTCEDPPGVRQGAFGDLFLAYLRDPVGNKICAVHRAPAGPSAP